MRSAWWLLRTAGSLLTICPHYGHGPRPPHLLRGWWAACCPTASQASRRPRWCWGRQESLRRPAAHVYALGEQPPLWWRVARSRCALPVPERAGWPWTAAIQQIADAAGDQNARQVMESATKLANAAVLERRGGRCEGAGRRGGGDGPSIGSAQQDTQQCRSYVWARSERPRAAESRASQMLPSRSVTNTRRCMHALGSVGSPAATVGTRHWLRKNWAAGHVSTP